MLLSEATTTGFDLFSLVPWIVFIPIIGLLINLIFGRKWNETVVGIVASSASGLAFVAA